MKTKKDLYWKKSVKPVLVEWIDSMGKAGWVYEHEEADTRCTSVGHLVKSDKKSVILALNTAMVGSYGDLITIPRSAVRRIRKLKI